MAKRDGTGPSKNSAGPRNGKGGGKGRNSGNGVGPRSGGKRGKCKR